MRVSRNLTLFAVIVPAAISLAATPSLTDIGVLTPAAADSGVAMSRINAISPDGTWAVGLSNGTNLGGTATMSQAIAWSAGSGLVAWARSGWPSARR